MRHRSLASAMAWLLLAVMGLQFAWLGSFEIRRVVVRQEVKLKLKAGVPMHERACFVFTSAEYAALKWLKPEKEFTFGEDFFDVIGKDVDPSGLIHLSCMNDRQEAALFADLAQLVENDMGQRGDGARRAQLLFGLLKVWSASTEAREWRVPVLSVPAHDHHRVQLLSGHAGEWRIPPRT